MIFFFFLFSVEKNKRDVFQATNKLGMVSQRACHGVDLEGDLGGHGEAVRDDGLLLRRAAFPHVQLHAATSGQQHLPVHLHRRAPRQLARYKQSHTAVGKSTAAGQ